MTTRWQGILGCLALLIAPACAEPSDGDDGYSTPPPAPLRRLTGEQYDNTVRDLLRIDSFGVINMDTPSQGLPADGNAGPFDANWQTSVTLTHVDQLALVAEAIARNTRDALEDGTITVRSLARCDDGSCCASQDEACAQAFITRFGLRAFRRPLTTEEEAGLLEVYQSGATGRGGFLDGIELTLAAFLQAPSMVYFVEGDGELNDYEVATRLSYFLWNTMPDDLLLDSAALGQLTNPDGILAHFDRMYPDPRMDRQLAEFHLSWLDLRERLPVLDKNATRYPLFGENRELVRSRLQRSFERYVSYIMHDADARYVSLMSAPVSFMGPDRDAGETGSDPVAQIYNVRIPSTHDFDTPMAVDPETRRGILTHPAYLASHAREVLPYPVGRGLNVIRNVLCLTIPPPPAGVVTDPPPIVPGLTRRQVFEQQHEAPAACAGCHTIIDPIGFTFDNYGALGEYRTFDQDDNAEVDATGNMSFVRFTELYSTYDIEVPGMDISTISAQLDGPVENAMDLVERLSVSRVAHDCYSLQWYRFALQREVAMQDEDALGELQDSFAGSGGDIRQLLRNIVTSDVFRSRDVTVTP